MKKILLGAVAAAAVAAPAHADTTGHIDFGYETAEVGNSDVDGWALGGAVITPLSGAWSLQFDAQHNTTTWDDSDYDNGASNATVHAIYGGDGFRAGAFAGFGSVYSQTLYMLGGEGQLNLGNMSFGGSLSWGDMSDAYDYTAWDARVNGAYFLSPNFAITADISYTEWDDYDDSAFGVGIGAEYRFADSPFSISGGYTNEQWDYGSSEDDADVFRIGMSFDFGSGSLQERTQSGASFDGAASFVDVWTRWD